MYCTTPSGTRYQTGFPARTRARQSVDEIANAGTSTRVTAPSGSCIAAVTGPGHADEVRQLEQLVDVLPGHDGGQRVGAGDEKPLGVRLAAARRSRRVSLVYVGPGRSTSTRDTVNRGLDAVAITVIR